MDDDALLDSIFAEMDDSLMMSAEEGNNSKRPRTPLGVISNSNSSQESRKRDNKGRIISHHHHHPRSSAKSSTPRARRPPAYPSSSSKPAISGPPVRTPTAADHLRRKATASVTPKPAVKQVHQDAALLQGISWSDEDEDDDDAGTPAPPPPSKRRARKSWKQFNPDLEALIQERKQPDYVPISRRFTRCVVKSVSEKTLKDWRREKTLVVEVHSTKDCRRIILFDEWATTEVDEGDIVNVIGSFQAIPLPLEEPGSSSLTVPDPVALLPTCVLSYSSENLLIVHPDTLISATRISDTPSCRRKAVVQEKLRGVNDTSSPALVYGNLLHELLQACLLEMSNLHARDPTDVEGMKEAFGVKKREEEIERLLKVPKNVEMLFMIGVELDEARHYLREKSLGYMEFADMFVGEIPKSEAYLSDPRIRDFDPTVSSRLCISSIHDIEEDVLSPRLGIKGKVDASVQATLVGPPGPAWPLGRQAESVTPFEIKTGRNSGMMQHRAQTMLYTQIMADRYDRPIESGLLYYTQTNSVIRVQAVRNELRGLIMGRNEMARYLTPPASAALAYAKKEVDDSRMALDMPPSQPPKLESSPVKPATTVQAGKRSIVKTEEMGDDEPSTKNKAEDDDDDALWAELDTVDPEEVKSSPVADTERPPLPSAIDDSRTCKKCYASDGCMLYRRAIDGLKTLSLKEDDPLEEMYQNKTAHLTDAQCEFFRKWERLISLEEREMLRFKKEIWTMTADERQKMGRCLADMVVDEAYTRSPVKPSRPASQKELDADAKNAKASIHRYTYRMVRSTSAPSAKITQLKATQAHLPSFATQLPSSQAESSEYTPPASLLSGHNNVGDPVLVSIEPSIIGLARGFVLEMQSDFMVVGLDHSLTALPGDRYHETVGYDTPGSLASAVKDVRYRIDKDELQAGMGRIRDNLARLFYAKDGDEKRLRMVVDLERPRFDKALALEAPRIPSECSKPLSSHVKVETPLHGDLNPDQISAVNKVLTAKDYALILGMPGTGKTTTIAEIIRTLVVERGKSVLLTSYTHSAVDNILLKIKDLDINILRLGNADRVMPQLSHLTLASKEPPTSIAQLEQRYFAPQVVATTALSIDHPLFSRRRFDYCIVDEASQITLPTCLGPLRYADTFVLVGDHNQLPPLVKNPLARTEGLETSLFRRLSEAHPSALVYLTHQYRMNADIMSLSNRLIYHNRLKCGSGQTAEQGLPIPDIGNVLERCVESHTAKDPCWIRDLMHEGRKVVFVDTDALPARESKSGRLVQNDKEAELVHQLGSALLAAGVRPDQLGVITLYRQQIKLLSQLFEESRQTGVEILTADKSQGRDKECILMSLTRSNTDAQVGELLRDWRRLNVCFTRAKQKLVIFGSKSTLSTLPLLEQFFALVQEKGWLYALPPGADTLHSRPNPARSRCEKKGGESSQLADRIAGTDRKKASEKVKGEEEEYASAQPMLPAPTGFTGEKKRHVPELGSGRRLNGTTGVQPAVTIQKPKGKESVRLELTERRGKLGSTSSTAVDLHGDEAKQSGCGRSRECDAVVVAAAESAQSNYRVNQALGTVKSSCRGVLVGRPVLRDLVYGSQ